MTNKGRGPFIFKEPRLLITGDALYSAVLIFLGKMSLSVETNLCLKMRPLWKMSHILVDLI